MCLKHESTVHISGLVIRGWSTYAKGMIIKILMIIVKNNTPHK